MLPTLAWKNVWRSKKRSLIIVLAISFGLWGGLLAGAIMTGWGESMVETAINRDLGHVQLHHPEFSVSRDVSKVIEDGEAVLSQIRAMPGVAAASGRTLTDGMAASANATFGVSIVGVEPSVEKTVTDIHELIVDGIYLSDGEKNRIVIGKKLADRLHLKLKSKVVLSFQALDDSLVYGAFRVVGIYKSASSLFDQSHVFVRQTDLQRLLAAPSAIHEIVVLANSSRQAAGLVDSLKAALPGLSIQSWKALSPEIAVTAAAMESWSYVFVGIILMALVFGITNTMLMAVMERVQELGILIAVGMKRRKVFLMILLETLMLSFTGGICGMLLGGGTISVLTRTGIDCSAFASSLESFGAATMLYPSLPAGMYAGLVAMIVAAAAIAAALPAMKAVRLDPANAIRS